MCVGGGGGAVSKQVYRSRLSSLRQHVPVLFARRNTQVDLHVDFGLANFSAF